MGDTQLDRNIEKVLELQNKAYGLLMWLAKGMDSGFIPPKNAHEYMSASEATKSWVQKHIQNLPIEYRPNIEDSEEINIFSNLFSTFLMTSFDIVDIPGQRLYSEGAHCFCPMCSYLINIPHLKSKRITKKEKIRAQKIKVATAEQFCLDNELKFSSKITNLATMDSKINLDLAIISYVNELVKRSKGFVEGPAVLALWREFAWDKSGSPKKKFKLTQKMYIEAINSIRLQFSKLG